MDIVDYTSATEGGLSDETSETQMDRLQTGVDPFERMGCVFKVYHQRLLYVWYGEL